MHGAEGVRLSTVGQVGPACRARAREWQKEKSGVHTLIYEITKMAVAKRRARPQKSVTQTRTVSEPESSESAAVLHYF